MAKLPAASDRSQFKYQTHLVIYKFLSLVPSSTQAATPDDLDNASMSSSVDGGTAHSVDNSTVPYQQSRRETDDAMFSELRATVAAREREREAGQRILMNKRLLKELKAKVAERDRHKHDVPDEEIPLLPITVIRKRNVVKVMMSPPIALFSTHSVASLVDGPLFSSAPPSVALGPAAPNFPSSDLSSHNGHSDKMSDSGSGSAEMMSSCVSDTGSTYFDISQCDDIKPLVSARVLPSIVESLREELHQGLIELETGSHSDEDEVDSQFGDTSDSPVSDDMDGTAASSSVPHKPTEEDMMEVADLLRQVGDQVQAHYGEEIERIIQNIDWLMSRAMLLQEFHRLSSDFLCRISDGWVRATVAILLCQRMVYRWLLSGYRGIGDVVKFTVQLIEDHAAQYIIDSGGWNSISELSGESPMCLSDDEFLAVMASDDAASSHAQFSSRASANDLDDVDNPNNNRTDFASSAEKAVPVETSRQSSADDTPLLVITSRQLSGDAVSDQISLLSYPDVVVGIVGLTVIAVTAYFCYQRFRRVT